MNLKWFSDNLRALKKVNTYLLIMDKTLFTIKMMIVEMRKMHDEVFNDDVIVVISEIIKMI